MEAHNRVLAVAKVHRSLYTSQNVQSVSLHLYIEALADDIRECLGRGQFGGDFFVRPTPWRSIRTAPSP